MVKASDSISGILILILFFHQRLGFPSGLVPSGFPDKMLFVFLNFNVSHAFPISFSFIPKQK
jgi:hypothetical protein